MKNRWKRILLVLLAIVAVGVFFTFDLGRFLNFDYVKSQRAHFQIYFSENPLSTILMFFLIYVLVTALSLPGATVMTLAAGMLFGLVLGTLIVSFASTIGASLAFLASRFLFRDFVQQKFGHKLSSINEGFEKEGAFYLFTLRLIPAFPFFMINLLMGLTPIGLIKYFFVSQIGMIAGTLVYVNAGTQLGQLNGLSGILSPSLIFSFVLLGIFPLLLKKILAHLRKRGSNNPQVPQ